ncbi:flagellar motor protein MotD [Azoarcus sp. TTM-91]|uniref:flagellar motor protein MotD n=1 Tax=Azoarcus sp. TTM-91 TaxID=2691581 RepID=UPI00145D0BFC|nr:flagellar motor protein MotD [Azoarcus sp. TTM-91]NMG33158.1 flagellar motor protein MotD [Azoarcus sp. TTM-91]
MPRRRRQEEEHENHERWLVSYADFITLLFAFFVVMYSLSSINEGKYRVLSDSLVQAFRNINVQDEGGQQIVLPQISAVSPAVPAPAAAPARTPEQEAAEARRQQVAQRMRNMADEIRRVLEPLTRGGQVSVSEGAFGITVEINASVLFAPGDAMLGVPAVSALRAVADVLAGADFPITIEGHTDNTPINTFRFPSNWELSAVRASSVVRLFVDAGVQPERLTAAGYADQRPVAANDTEEGRSRNRRVTIMIESRMGEPAPAAPGRIPRNDPIRSILPPEPAAASTP